MRFVSQVGIVALLLLSTARAASAICGGLEPTLSPRSDVVLPPDPTVYLFAEPEAWDAHEVRLTASQGAQALATTVREVGRSDAWVALRVDVDTVGAGELEMHAFQGDWEGEPRRYRIGGDVPADTATVLMSQPFTYDWSCSHTRAVAITVQGPAAAYRLEWAADAAALAQGPVQSAWLLPSEVDGGPASPRVIGAQQLLVGHLSCRGFDVPPTAFEKPRAVRLVAVFADGREAELPLGTMQLDEHRMQVPEDFAAPLIAAPPAPSPTIAPVAWPRMAVNTGDWLILPGVAGLLILALNLRLYLRREARVAVDGTDVAP